MVPIIAHGRRRRFDATDDTHFTDERGIYRDALAPDTDSANDLIPTARRRWLRWTPSAFELRRRTRPATGGMLL